MLILPIQIIGPNGIVERDAIVDTGLPGGLLLPKSVARSLGAVLVEPARPVRAVDGRVLPGFATILRVRVPRAGVETDTYVFCPESTTREVLLGSMFLAEVRATIVIGSVELKFPPTRRARSNPSDKLDVGDWVLPTNRPVTPWW